jgi:hypothetical protein
VNAFSPFQTRRYLRNVLEPRLCVTHSVCRRSRACSVHSNPILKIIDFIDNGTAPYCLKFISRLQNAGLDRNARISSTSFENITKFNYLERTVTNQSYFHD